MSKFKSAAFRIISSIMAFGMALTMSFFSPILQGYDINLPGLIKNTIITGAIAFIFSAILPLRPFCQWLLSSIRCKGKEHIETALFAFFMVSIMIIINLIIADRFTFEQARIMSRIFIPLLVIAYFTSYLFKAFATEIVKRIEASN